MANNSSLSKLSDFIKVNSFLNYLGTGDLCYDRAHVAFESAATEVSSVIRSNVRYEKRVIDIKTKEYEIQERNIKILKCTVDGVEEECTNYKFQFSEEKHIHIEYEVLDIRIQHAVLALANHYYQHGSMDKKNPIKLGILGKLRPLRRFHGTKN